MLNKEEELILKMAHYSNYEFFSQLFENIKTKKDIDDFIAIITNTLSMNFWKEYSKIIDDMKELCLSENILTSIIYFYQSMQKYYDPNFKELNFVVFYTNRSNVREIINILKKQHYKNFLPSNDNYLSLYNDDEMFYYTKKGFIEILKNDEKLKSIGDYYYLRFLYSCNQEDVIGLDFCDSFLNIDSDSFFIAIESALNNNDLDFIRNLYIEESNNPSQKERNKIVENFFYCTLLKFLKRNTSLDKTNFIIDKIIYLNVLNSKGHDIGFKYVNKNIINIFKKLNLKQYFFDENIYKKLLDQ